MLGVTVTTAESAWDRSGPPSIQPPGDPVIFDRVRLRCHRLLIALRQVPYLPGHITFEIGDGNHRHIRARRSAAHAFHHGLGKGTVIPFVPLEGQLVSGGGSEHDDSVLCRLQLVGELVNVGPSIRTSAAQHVTRIACIEEEDLLAADLCEVVLQL